MAKTDPLLDVVEVKRSTRRRRTVSAYRDGERIVVLIPARLTRVQEQEVVAEMVEKITKRELTLAKRGPRVSDTALADRATRLSGEHLESRAAPQSVRWVRNMEHRWGSCTPAEGSIRLSHRLQAMPDWVIDYVLVHELSHLLESGHGPEFWRWVNRYPKTERARGFLDGVALAAQLPGLSDCGASGESVSPGAGSVASD